MGKMSLTVVVAALVIEAIIFLIPFIKLWTSVGQWKGEVEQKIMNTQNQVASLNGNLSEMNKNFMEISNQLAVISAKVTLLIEDKIKKGSYDAKDN